MLCQCGGGLLCPRILSVPKCLLATFGGGLYRYKQKTGLSKSTKVYKTLLSQLLIFVFLAISTMPQTVIADSSTLKQQAGIIVKFAEHPQAEYAWFSETLNHAHPIFIDGSAYDRMWTNGNDKKVLQGNTLSTLKTKVRAVVKAKSEDGAKAKKDTPSVKSMNKALERGKIWRLQSDNGKYKLIHDTSDLGAYIKRIQNDANIPDMEASRENTWIVLYNQTSRMFPARSGISCKDWSEILASAPTVVTTGTNAIVTNTGNMATSVAKLTRATIEERKMKARSEAFNWNNLPNLVKAQYKDCAEKKLIKRSDIFVLVGDKWNPRTYRNKYTKEASSTPGIPGTQRNLSMMEYPDKAYSESGGIYTRQYNYVVNMGGYVAGFLDQLTKEQEKDFIKCANKMEN